MLPTDPDILVRSIERTFRRVRLLAVFGALVGAAAAACLGVLFLAA